MDQRFQPPEHTTTLHHSQSSRFNGHQRYRLLELLGQGGMGVVCRAYDRLTGQTVALKQITVAPQELHFSSRSASDDQHQLLLSLAQEFKFLASLRHPNIISVFDYGFDAERKPYFSMELLTDAQTLRQAAKNQPLAVQVDLLVQTLQALAYLHRRGILHHDLKPENVLVCNGQVRVLDFGLSVMRQDVRLTDSLGTLFYLPPEVFTDVPYSIAADLYALGVIAYELLVGRHPFYTSDLDEFFAKLMQAEADLTLLPASLRPVIGALLAKEPDRRYPDAEQAIAALYAATNQPPAVESVAIRDSFLQAATFVGREDELLALTAALGAAQRGKGSAWLVGGESGVGKSRLLDELRIQALVAGTVVLHGQAVEGGGAPYQLWREPLRRLVLTAELSALEAGVLKPLVPDIAILLERAVPDAPALSAAESSQRLVWTVTELLRRQPAPLVLLFEDLQWAEESLSLLNDVVQLTTDRPLFIVGTYRDDERPQLPDEVPGTQILHLNRLSTAAIAQLSEAMLGEQGRQPQIVALLQHETEGNTFFMVEVVRALAEESGGLANIGEVTLPAQIFTGGVQRLVERRLQHVAAGDFPLLQLAAVLGRQIDLPVLQTVIASSSDSWLLRCANVAVLEVQGGQWRFAHDKLREGVLRQLSSEQRIALNRQAAEGIIAAYANDLAPQAGRLAGHYQQVGDAEREADYAQQAGDYATKIYAYSEALRFYSRALELTTDQRQRFTRLLAREAVYAWRGNRVAQAADLQTLTQLAEQLDDDLCRLEAAQRELHYLSSINDHSALFRQVQRILALAQPLNHSEAQASAYLRWGYTLFRLADFAQARDKIAQALAIAQQAQFRGLIADCYLLWAYVFSETGDQAQALRLFDQVLQIGRELGDKRRELYVFLSFF
jgi:tetratricopeptide (TPR) repeat protein